MEDLRHYISFEDPTEWRTWVFDLTFLLSSWACIYGRGCPGIEAELAPEGERGCCTHGAHFTDDRDVAETLEAADRLDDELWQFRRLARRRGGAVRQNRDGDWVTRLTDGACIFLNRPGFSGGAGCALHRGALAAGERPLDWKPDVCWQVPLRLDEATDVNGHVTSTLREWRRRDWGDGGHYFGWWCTEEPDAFISERSVLMTMEDEIRELIGDGIYRMLVDAVREQFASDAGRSLSGGRPVELRLVGPERLKAGPEAVDQEGEL